MPTDLENIVKGLKQIASEAMKKEGLVVEDRIKAFTDEQYNLLNRMREKTFREQQALIRIIINNFVNNSKQPESTNQGVSNPTTMPSRLNEPLAAGSVKTGPVPISNPTRHTPKRQKSCPAGHLNSFDSEGLFSFDGIEDETASDGSDIEDSEPEEDESSNKTGRIVNVGGGGGGGQRDSNSIAKSLPMSIPVFMTRGHIVDEVEDILPVEDNLDIAASIKALAKSVHGDAVFGDLPKPRYSTHI